MTNVVAVFAVTAMFAICTLCQAAQPYPERPIRFVNGSPAGGPTDAAVASSARRCHKHWASRGDRQPTRRGRRDRA